MGTGATFDFFGIFAGIFAIIFAISIVWIFLDYFLVYRNLKSPLDLPKAQSPALILGIIQLLFGGFIPGILLLVAYLKIGDAMKAKEQYAPASWK